MGHTSTESLEAFAAGDKDALRKMVSDHIRGQRFFGATADEATGALGLTHNSVAPRFVELARAGRIVKLVGENGESVRRKTRQGSPAAVWIAAEFAPKVPESLFGPLAPTHKDLG